MDKPMSVTWEQVSEVLDTVAVGFIEAMDDGRSYKKDDIAKIIRHVSGMAKLRAAVAGVEE